MLLLSDDGFWALAVDGLPDDESIALKGFGFRMILQNMTQYNRRLLEPLNGTHLTLLRFAASPAYQPCPLRQAIAQHIRGCPEHVLEGNARKIKALFPADVEFAARTGMCGEELFELMHQARRTIKASVRPNERAHSMIKCMTRRSPNIQLPLISSRLTIKSHFEGLLDSKHKSKMTQLRLRGSNLVDRCLESGEACKAVLNDEGRFAYAEPICPNPMQVIQDIRDDAGNACPQPPSKMTKKPKDWSYLRLAMILPYTRKFGNGWKPIPPRVVS